MKDFAVMTSLPMVPSKRFHNQLSSNSSESVSSDSIDQLIEKMPLQIHKKEHSHNLQPKIEDIEVFDVEDCTSIACKDCGVTT